MKPRPLTECEQLQKQIDLLTAQVRSLENKNALLHHQIERRVHDERQKWIVATSAEVDPIRDRIRGRVK